jgi:hypothetical protein
MRHTPPPSGQRIHHTRRASQDGPRACRCSPITNLPTGHRLARWTADDLGPAAEKPVDHVAVQNRPWPASSSCSMSCRWSFLGGAHATPDSASGCICRCQAGGPCSAPHCFGWPPISRQHTIFYHMSAAKKKATRQSAAFRCAATPAAAPDRCRRTREVPRHPHAAAGLNFNVTPSPLSIALEGGVNSEGWAATT